MTLLNFAKNLKRIQTGATTVKRRRVTKPIEIIDDVVTVGSAGDGWDKIERNGRVYVSRR